jgi:hypothetical protein
MTDSSVSAHYPRIAEPLGYYGRRKCSDIQCSSSAAKPSSKRFWLSLILNPVPHVLMLDSNPSNPVSNLSPGIHHVHPAKNEGSKPDEIKKNSF